MPPGLASTPVAAPWVLARRRERVCWVAWALSEDSPPSPPSATSHCRACRTPRTRGKLGAQQPRKPQPPFAQRSSTLRNRDVTIAGLQQQVAKSGRADLATSLLAYAQEPLPQHRVLVLSGRTLQSPDAAVPRSRRAYRMVGATGSRLRTACAHQHHRLRLLSRGLPGCRWGRPATARPRRPRGAIPQRSARNGANEVHLFTASDFPLQFAQSARRPARASSKPAIRPYSKPTLAPTAIAFLPPPLDLSAREPGRSPAACFANSGVSDQRPGRYALQLSIRPADGLPITEFDITLVRPERIQPAWHDLDAVRGKWDRDDLGVGAAGRGQSGRIRGPCRRTVIPRPLKAPVSRPRCFKR